MERYEFRTKVKILFEQNYHAIFRNHVFNGLNGLAAHQIVDGEPNQDHVVRIEKNLNAGVAFALILASGVTGDNSSNHVQKVF